MVERRTWVQQWIDSQQARQAATAAMEATIVEMAAEESTEEEEDELTPLEAWWQECLKEDQKFKESKRDYLERYERDYWNQVENERKAKEYTKYGLDNWLEVLERGIKERMEEEKKVWCTKHRKKVTAKAQEFRAKKRRIEGVNPQDSTEKKQQMRSTRKQLQDAVT